MVILYPSNVASVNELFDYYKRYKVNIMNNNSETFITRDPSGIIEYCQIPALPSTNIKFDEMIYIISTRITPDNFECASPTVEIIIDTDREYAWHQHTISCHGHSIGYFYRFYHDKGIRWISITINTPNKNLEYDDNPIFNIDLTKDNIKDAISICDLGRLICTNDEVVNKIIGIGNEVEDDWYDKATCYVNGFEIEQFIYTDGTMDESIKINADKIGWYE